MTFNSLAFLVLLGATAALNYSLPPRWRWLALLGASIYFYSALQPAYLLLLGYATAVAYGLGLAVAAAATPGRRRAMLALGVVLQLAVLVAFKYLDFIAATLEPPLRQLSGAGTLALPRLDWVLPAGLSFYAFSCIAYLVDVARGTVAVERHFGHLALYVAFFPKLLAGPIERAGPFLAQLRSPRPYDRALVAAGLWLVLWGLVKKVVIADRLAEFVDPAFKTVSAQSPVTLALAVYLYAFQIYCDFSGYADIAIGAARILGISLMENFRRPYFARSVAEFWSRRWHLSLAAWLRDYLYIPLGGGRRGEARRLVNLMLVFAVSGLWHGANWTFLAWGAINGALTVVHHLLVAPRAWLARRLAIPEVVAAPLQMLATFHLIAFGWIFFRAASLADAGTVIARIWNALPQLPVLARNYNWTTELQGSLALIALLLAVEALDERRALWTRLAAAPAALRWGACYAAMLALLVIGRWGATQFVYMQF